MYFCLVGNKPYSQNLTILATNNKTLMSASANSTSKNVKQHRCNICKITFDTIETLNAHNRMEHSENKHSPAGVS
jgi:hypothetical protein